MLFINQQLTHNHPYNNKKKSSNYVYLGKYFYRKKKPKIFNNLLINFIY